MSMLKIELFWFSTIFQMALAQNVAIIGAGIAGLRAARELQNSGINFTIFEGSHRIGGRVFPLPYKSGHLQFGAEYVNGRENEIYEIVKKYQLSSSTELEDDDVETYIDGKEVREGLLNTWYAFEDATTRAIEKEAGAKLFSLSNISERVDFYYKDFLALKNFPSSDLKVLEKLKKIYLNYYQMEWSGKADEVCLSNLYVWDSGKEDVEFTLNKDGFKVILDEMTKTVPMEKIRLNSKVTNVDYSGPTPQITLSNHQSFTFDAIIITSSLGYLKPHHHTLFTPTLPTKKIAAIQSAGYGNNMKIFLEYEKRWWPRGATFQLATSLAGEPLENELMVFQASLWAEHILVVWLAGDGPLLASKLSDAQLLSVINKYLLDALKNQYKVTDSKKLYRHNWINDEFALGSYSFISRPSCSSNDIKVLAEPLMNGKRPVICFAGEHTDLSMYQTVVGAARSGLREATRILKGFQ